MHRPISAARLTPRVVWSLVGETAVEWYEDRAPRLGAALAFYTVFSLAPGLIVIIALAAQGQNISEVQDLIGSAGAHRSARRAGCGPQQARIDSASATGEA